ncbi:Cof-type HAD-IIB family hydrolase [Flaviflagellibacter deserti]|uniref:Cof-type HAD-IIB family hydrolase n=1 Tax=Flaviflagellibacter deserti TaxID=2267266 RepID=A0ABV9YWX0_9HYPH
MSAAPPIRLLISDVDGTLVHYDKSLSDVNIAGFRRLREAGISATLISARPPSGIQWIADELEIERPLGAFNGGTIFSRDGAVQFAVRLEPEVVSMVVAALDEAGVEPWLFAHGLWYARSTGNPHVPREILSASVQPTLGFDLTSLTKDVDKIVGVSDDHDLLKAVEEKVKALVGARATAARSQAYFLDVTAVPANKGDGVVALAKAAGVPLSEVAVIGDMANDLPMFARAGLSIAMGQAPDAVRQAANYVTASNDEDGVAAAIDRFILNKLPAR